MQHGGPTSTSRHVGDLGNIVSINSEEKTVVMVEDGGISLKKSAISNIVNRTIVIHEKADNFRGPSGYAGARIACGVVSKTSLDQSSKLKK